MLRAPRCARRRHSSAPPPPSTTVLGSVDGQRPSGSQARSVIGRFLSGALVILAACGKHHPAQSFAGLTAVSGASPFPSNCIGAGQMGINFRSAEVEPFLAIDPKDPLHLVGVWQQDRWSNGGANGLGSAASFDGGKTWTKGFAHFTLCSGGNAVNRAIFERASDPWVTFAGDCAPHAIAFT